MINEIVRIELTPLYVPFRPEVRKAMESGEGQLGMAIGAEEPWLGGDFVICKLVCDDGTTGLGESFVWLPETGISPEQIISTIKGCLAKYILGESPFNVERIQQRFDANITRNEVAKGLLDKACYDLMGKITGRPACHFMGGQTVNEIPLAALIPLTDTETMVGLAEMFHRVGYRAFRLKLGKGVREDREIVESFRDALGSDVALRVDYNQAYEPPEAVRAIRAIEPFDIDFAEQPVNANDYLGMAYVQKRVDTPLMAHEGCFSVRDFVTLVELGAVGVLGLNSERPGGVTNAIKVLNYAELRGIGAVLHNQPLGIASAMHIHLAAARPHNFWYETELFGYVMFEDDLIKDPIDYSDGKAKLPQGPGWGVELDEEALAKYATGPTTVIKK
ncbi:MAG: mandelate racemase/muconate lactonizing enzyme family protein [Candidatus Freyarchaeota archaeon]